MKKRHEAKAQRVQSGDQLLQLAEWLYNAPLMYERGRLDALLSIPISEAPTAGFYRWHDEDEDLAVQDGVATIKVVGPLRKTNWSLSRSYEGIQKNIEKALGQESVRGILLDIDSGGGSVDGVFDLSDFIFEARERKPIWAIADDFAASAAYAIGSAASRMYLSRTAGVGSVGVIANHVEFSKMDERHGVKITTIFSGDRKNDFSDSEPLNSTAKQLLQEEVDRLRGIFAAGVARNRGLSVDAVMGTEAALYRADAAVEVGFADGVQSAAETISQFKSALASQGGTSALNRADAPAPDGETTMSKNKTETETKAGAETPDGSQAAPEAPDKGTKGTEAAPSGAEVVDLDAARSEGRSAGREATREEFSAIKQICDVAGCPERAADFFEAGKTEAQVRETLLGERAEKGGDEIDAHPAPAGGNTSPVPSVREVYSRWNNVNA